MRPRLAPAGIAALFAMPALPFAFQGERILAEPAIIALRAVLIVIQVHYNSALACRIDRRLGVAQREDGPSALVGALNFFARAVAAAKSVFGLNWGAALATVACVLAEVRVMLAVVCVVNRSGAWHEAGAPPARA